MPVDARPLLRFVTAGSVDDGKSTLIGRLLRDANGVYLDQLEAIEKYPAANGTHAVDFSLLTDGLRAEREQGITIDVAYRYFGTPHRKFILADVPGHEQYTRNMATGASTADAAVLLVDARKGVLSQTCRHAAIAWYMGIRNFVVAVNKMDLVGFEEHVYREIYAEFQSFLQHLGDVVPGFIPCCAPDGDNIVNRSERMPWYEGRSVLEALERIPLPLRSAGSVLRFPVQIVIRSEDGTRYYAGQLASGVVRKNATVLALNSGRTARIIAVRDAGGPVDSAAAPLSIAIQLEEHIDAGRGEVFADPAFPPISSRRFSARLLWMSKAPLVLERPYLVKHTTRYVCGTVVSVVGGIDTGNLTQRSATTVAMNELAEVELETHHPLYVDCYDENRATGSFIIVDPISNETVAAGMITRPVQLQSGPVQSTAAITPAMTIWFTGLSSAGKTTISRAVYEKLWAKGYKLELLDGDAIRQHISKDLGFSKEDRDENVRRIGFMAELLSRNGVIAMVAAISPYRIMREEMRARIGNFIEVYVNASLDVVEQRDVKSIYRRCRAGEIHGVSGIDDPYEPPLAPEVECRTDRETLAESTNKVMRVIEARLEGLLT